MGVLVLEWPPGRALNYEERSLLEALCAQLGLILEKEHLASAMQRAEIAERSNRLHKALLDSVSHELKTPIAALRASLDLLIEPEHSRNALLQAEMQTATRRLERVTTQLLDMTRIEGGLLRPQCDWCDLDELLRSAIAHHVSVSQRPRVTIEVPAGFPPVYSDPGLLETCVTNLLLNALAYSPQNLPVEAAVSMTNVDWTLSIRDHGPGIPEELIPRLFDKFFRAPQTQTGGTGLGLSVVRGFVRALGGEVSARNAPGGGALFTLTFPRQPAPAS
jgi:two-component system sensor histidine kinase KdpD